MKKQIVMTKFFDEFNYLTWSWNPDTQYYQTIYNDAYGNQYQVNLSHILFTSYNIDSTVKTFSRWIDNPIDTVDQSVSLPFWISFSRRDFQISKIKK